jgi:hypothetical protein
MFTENKTELDTSISEQIYCKIYCAKEAPQALYTAENMEALFLERI